VSNSLVSDYFSELGYRHLLPEQRAVFTNSYRSNARQCSCWLVTERHSILSNDIYLVI